MPTKTRRRCIASDPIEDTERPPVPLPDRPDGARCIASDPIEDTERPTPSAAGLESESVASPPIRLRILKGESFANSQASSTTLHRLRSD